MAGYATLPAALRSPASSHSPLDPAKKMSSIKTPSETVSLLQRAVRHLVQAPRFERFILALIVLTAIILGLETSKNMMARF